MPGPAGPGNGRRAGSGAAEPPRDVFLYVISGFKPRNPAAAMALIDRLGGSAIPAAP